MGTLTPGTIGRMRLDRLVGENSIATFDVPPSGCVWLKDQIGCVPFGAAIVASIPSSRRSLARHQLECLPASGPSDHQMQATAPRS